MAQLVKRRTGTPLTLVLLPGAVKDFSPRVVFQCRLSSVVVRTPSCAIASINICAHVRDPCSPRQSLIDYGNTKTASMHRRLGSAPLSQLAFLTESDPNFP